MGLRANSETSDYGAGRCMRTEFRACMDDEREKRRERGEGRVRGWDI